MIFSTVRWREALFLMIVSITCIDGRSQRKRRDAETNLCGPLQAPAHGTIACGAGFPFYTCTATCDSGYHFPSGKTSDKRECDQMFGEWFDPPGKIIPNCVPSCKPECVNGGTCILPNVCTCPDAYMGKVCQYPTSNCVTPPDPHNGKLICSHDTSGARCTAVCNSGFKPAWPISPSYVCYPDGTWSPPKSEIPHCVPESTVLNSSVVNVSTNHPSTGSARCVAWGQDHYRTFDNKVYHYKGACSYVLVKDAVSNSFHIHVQNDKNCQTSHRCKRELKIFMGNEVISLKRDVNGPSIKWNGASITIPSNKGGVIFEKVSHYIIIRSNIGFQVRWDGYEMIFVTVSDDLRGKTRGLCGIYDGDQTNDFTTDTGVVVSEPAAFVTTWKRSLAGEICPDTPQTGCNTANNQAISAASRQCDALMGNEFAACHHAVDPRPYISACTEDCCSASKADCTCSSIQAYTSECLKLKININWRSEHHCPMKCPTNQVYKECGSMCARTCQSPAAACEDHSCIDGCFCPDGMVFHNDSCVQQSQCPCLLNGKEYSSGEVVPDECNKCTCTGGSWKCTTRRCDATCSAVGDPHYMTFDGKRYDFMGQCSYYLIHDTNYDVIADNIRCGHGEASCTKSITIHISGHKITMDHNHQLFVDGQEIVALPFQNDGIKIYMVSSLFMKAELVNGIRVLWDGRTRAYITAPPTFINKTRGLCGTYDFNQKNDFKTLQGDIETSINAFGNRWKTVPTCINVVKNPGNPCEQNVNRKNQSTQYCAYLKSDIFQPCHDIVDPSSFYSDCTYDVCACTENLRDCLCPMLGEYAAQCAAKGVDIRWRLHVPECHIPCTGGQEYQVCPNECTRTCSNIANDPHCVQSSVCAEGCGCPANQTLDDKGNCITIDSCPCEFSGHKFNAGTNVSRGDQFCTCVKSKWECVKNPSKNHFDGEKYSLCPPNYEYSPCVSDCPLTCENMYDGSSTCNTTTCTEGCECKPGFVKEGNDCVLMSECPCYHGGVAYREGETFNMECNKCTCRSRQWVCEDKDCPAVCSAYGDSHYTTFDGKSFEFQGSCDYVFAKSTDTNPIKFEITTENIPCGTTGVTCTRSISFSIGEQGTAQFYRIQLIKGKPVIAESGSPFHVRVVGNFIIITTPQGLTLEWDKGTRLYLKLRTEHKGKVFGLCGNFNGNQKDEFTTPQGGPPASKATTFADSWKVHSFCAKSREITDTCETNKDRQPWAQQRCSVISSNVFEKCHGLVPYKEYIDRCVFDACACDSGGDCECVCTAIAAYAHQCAMNGIIINWRTREFCPIPCKNCQTYSPCVSTCPRKTCENRLTYHTLLQDCGQETCVEGCAVKPCPPGQVYVGDEEPWKCVPEAFCNTSCTTINGKSYKEGEIITESSVCKLECETCYCDGGKIKKFGNCNGTSTSTSTVSPRFQTGSPTVSHGLETGYPKHSPSLKTDTPVTGTRLTVSTGFQTDTPATRTGSTFSPGFQTGIPPTGTGSTISPGFQTGQPSTVSPGFQSGIPLTRAGPTVSPGFPTGTQVTTAGSTVSPGFQTGTPVTGARSTVSPGFQTGTPVTGAGSTVSPDFKTGTPTTGTGSTVSPDFQTGTPTTGTGATVSPGFQTGTPVTGAGSTVSPDFQTGTSTTSAGSTVSPDFQTGSPTTGTGSTVSPDFQTGTPVTGAGSTASPGFQTGTPVTGAGSTVSPGFQTGTPVTGAGSTVSPDFKTGTPTKVTGATVSPGFQTGTPVTGTGSTVSPDFQTGTPTKGTGATVSPGFQTGTPVTGAGSTVSPDFQTGTSSTRAGSTVSPDFQTGSPTTGTGSTVSPDFQTGTPVTGAGSTVSPGFQTGTPVTGAGSTVSPDFQTGTPTIGAGSTVSPDFQTGSQTTGTGSTVSQSFQTGTSVTGTGSTVSPGFQTGTPVTRAGWTASPGFQTGTPVTGTGSTVSSGFQTGSPVTGAGSTVSPDFQTGTPTTEAGSTVSPDFQTGTPTTGIGSIASPGFQTGTPVTGAGSTVSPDFQTGTPTTGAGSTVSQNFQTGTQTTGAGSTVSPDFQTGTPVTGAGSTASLAFQTVSPVTGAGSTVSPGFQTGTPVTGAGPTVSPDFQTGTPVTGAGSTVSPRFQTVTPSTGTGLTVSPGIQTGTPVTGAGSTVSPDFQTGTPARGTDSNISPGFETGRPSTGAGSTVSPGFQSGTTLKGKGSTFSPGFQTGIPVTATESTVSPSVQTGTPVTGARSTGSQGFHKGTPVTGAGSTVSPRFQTVTPSTGTGLTVSPGIQTGTPVTGAWSTVSPGFQTGTPVTGARSTVSPDFQTGTPARGTDSNISPGFETGRPSTGAGSTASPGFQTGTPVTGTGSTASLGFQTVSPVTGAGSTVSPGFQTGTPVTGAGPTVSPDIQTGTLVTGAGSTVSPRFQTVTPSTGTGLTVSPGIQTGTPVTGAGSTVSPGFQTGSPVTGARSTVSPDFQTGTPARGTDSNISPGFETGRPSTGAGSTVSPGFQSGTTLKGKGSTFSPGFQTGISLTAAESTVSPSVQTGTPVTGARSTGSQGFHKGTPVTGAGSTVSPRFQTVTPSTGTGLTVSPGIQTGTPVTGAVSTVSPGFQTGTQVTGARSTVSPDFQTGTPARGTDSNISAGFQTGRPSTGAGSTVSQGFQSGTTLKGKGSTFSPGFQTGIPVTAAGSTVSPSVQTGTPVTGARSTGSQGFHKGTPVTGARWTVSPGFQTGTLVTGTGGPSTKFASPTPGTGTEYMHSLSNTTTPIVPIPNFHFPVLCREKMGIEKGHVKQEMITVSSSRDGNVCPKNSALNSPGAWMANKNDGDQYIQVNFLFPQILTGVITQGNKRTDWFVTSYVIYFSSDGLLWTPYTEVGHEKVFQANRDGHSEALNWFEHAIRAQYIRIIPKSWQGGIAMRLELLGCYQGTTTVVPPQTGRPYPPATTDGTNAQQETTPPINGSGYSHLTPCFEGLDMSSCPTEGCQEGLFCDGLKCVKKEECSCMVDGQIVLPGRFKESSTCDTCKCAAGELTCTSFRCPQCDHGLSITVKRTTCECGCEACKIGQYRCGSGKCIVNSHRCDGIIDCIDDEIGCASTPMFTPPIGNTATPTLAPSTGLYSSPATRQQSAFTQEPVQCRSRWSDYFNRDKPETGDGDREMLSNKELGSFCGKGKVTGIECVTTDGIPSYSTGEIMQCSIEGGSVCLTDDNFPVPCSDYKIRYFCTCEESTTVTSEPGKDTTTQIIWPTTDQNVSHNQSKTETLPPGTKTTLVWPPTDKYGSPVTISHSSSTADTTTPSPVFRLSVSPQLCKSQWSSWINKDKPMSGDGDIESWSRTERELFCVHGKITEIECVTDSGIPSYSNGEIMQCTLDGGSVCRNADNFPVTCSDYKIRYYCACHNTPTSSITTDKATSSPPTASVPSPTVSVTYFTTATSETSERTVTTPGLCHSHWSSWINTDRPTTGDGDRELWSKTEKETFCGHGYITGIECVTDSGIPSYSTGDIMQCSIEGGAVCLNADNFPAPCSDYKIRYFCTCSDTLTAAPPNSPVTGGHQSSTTDTTNKTPFGVMCQEGWSTWINRDSPNNGTGEIERMTQHEMSQFCSGGRISEIECITATGIPSFSTGEIISCSVNNGLECLNENNFPVPCSDYKVRYLCSCIGVPTLPPPKLSTNLPTLSPPLGSTTRQDGISPNTVTGYGKTTTLRPFPDHVTEIPVTGAPCIPESCPPLTRPTVMTGEVLRIVFDDRACCTKYEVFCKPEECTPSTMICPTPMVLQTANPNECCPTYRCMCPTSCPPMQTPNCSYGSEAVEVQVGCNCTQFICVTKSVSSTCTYIATNNTSANAAQIYQIGDSWSDGQCRQCTCVDKSEQAEISCQEITCPFCKLGYKRVLNNGECCGKCEPTGCLVNGTVYKNGQFIQTYEPCYTRKCVHDTALDMYIIVDTQVKCPAIDTLPTCLNNESHVDNNGCCLKCIPAANSSCQTCKPRLVFGDVSKTTGYFSVTDNGEACRNLQPVPDLKECSGYCDSRSAYSHVIQGFTHQCNCCQATKSETRTITLTCSSGRSFQKTYSVPTVCSCSTCHAGQK